MRFVRAVAPLHSRTGKYSGTKSEAHALQEWKQVRGSGSTNQSTKLDHRTLDDRGFRRIASRARRDDDPWKSLTRDDTNRRTPTESSGSLL